MSPEDKIMCFEDLCSEPIQKLLADQFFSYAAMSKSPLAAAGPSGGGDTGRRLDRVSGRETSLEGKVAVIA